jgi:hypothetical protein
MSQLIQSEELKSIAARELLVCGLAADAIEAFGGDNRDWSVRLHIGGRRFEIGSEMREGFYCGESTEGRTKIFVEHDSAKFGDPARLLKESFGIIRHAIDHPEFEGITRRII